MSLPPAMFPEWATEDKQSSETGQYNVAVPPLEVRQEGWLALKNPNRQWWNWFNRTVYDWIVYFNGIIGTNPTSTPLSPIWGGLTNQPTVNDFYYSLVGDKCFFQGTMEYTGNANTTDPLELTNLPFPPKIAPALRQVIQVERGTAATIANGKSLYGKIGDSIDSLIIRETDLASGTSTDTLIKGASGEVRYGGFYYIEPAP